MANVLHRTTKVYLVSVNTPDYPEATWIINPDVTAVAGWPTRYWVITGDAVSLMSQAQRDAVDAALLDAARTATAAAFDDVEDIERAFALTALDEFNLHAARITAILNAVDGAGSYGAMRAAIAAIQDVPQRNIAQLKTVLRAKLGT